MDLKDRDELTWTDKLNHDSQVAAISKHDNKPSGFSIICGEFLDKQRNY